MRTHQAHTLESLRAVQTFLADHATSLPTVAASGARIKLDDVIRQLREHAATQTGSDFQARGTTKHQRALRRALVRKHLAPIARIARAALGATPALDAFRVPRGKPTAERLAAAAAGMAAAAQPHVALFQSYGLPVDFLDRLTGAARALLDAIDDGKQRRGARAGATRGIAELLSDGRKLVRVLDAFVHGAVDDDPALLANWDVVKRVRGVASRTTAVAASIATVAAADSAPATLISVSSEQPPRRSILLTSPATWIRRRGDLARSA